MWTFKAKYDNVDTYKSIERTIQFDGDNAGMNEEECFKHAVTEAFRRKADNECLANVEFISC